MATNKPTRYLRNLDVDPTATMDDLNNRAAPERSDEFRRDGSRTKLPQRKGLPPGPVRALGVRPDPLLLPPGQAPTGPGSEIPASGAPAQPDPVGKAPRAPEPRPGPVDESWWKVDLSSQIVLSELTTITIGVSGSEHRKEGLSQEGAAALVDRVRDAMAAEVARTLKIIEADGVDALASPPGPSRAPSRERAGLHPRAPPHRKGRCRAPTGRERRTPSDDGSGAPFSPFLED